MERPVKFIHELSEDEIIQMTPEQILALSDQAQRYHESRPHTHYAIATEGAKTRDGGVVQASMDLEKRPTIGGLRVVVVGDEVVYPNGERSPVVSGAGRVLQFYHHAVALVGSALANGDVITTSPQGASTIRIYGDEPEPEGFLVPNWSAPAVH